MPPCRPISQPSGYPSGISRADVNESGHGTEDSLLNQPQDKRFPPHTLVLVGAPPASGYQPVCHHKASPTLPLRVTAPGTPPKRGKDLKAEGLPGSQVGFTRRERELGMWPVIGPGCYPQEKQPRPAPCAASSAPLSVGGLPASVRHTR